MRPTRCSASFAGIGHHFCPGNCETLHMSQLLLARSALASNLLRLLLALLVGFALVSGARALAPSAGERWVILATRALDTKTGRASIDLKKAKGAFKAVRLTVKTGALTLTRVELTYDDGTVVRVRRRWARRGRSSGHGRIT